MRTILNPVDNLVTFPVEILGKTPEFRPNSQRIPILYPDGKYNFQSHGNPRARHAE